MADVPRSREQQPEQAEPLEDLEELDSPRTGPSSDLIAGRYRLVRELGAGGQGHTFLAFDETRGTEVALKRFDLRAATDWKKVELFERECAVLRSLQSPSVPRYLEQFEEGGVYYLAMERVIGESLQQRRARGVRMTEAEVWRVLHEVGAILDMLHGLQPPVIHRDLKPHNLIRRTDGTIALVDFGAVRDMLLGAGGSTVAGTFGYMAPEQLHGQASSHTDVYGLGATVVALLTGREPEQLKHKGLRIDLRAEVSASPALIAVLERMLEPDPEHRPASVKAAMGAYAPPIEPPPASARTRTRVAEQPPEPASSKGATTAPRETFDPWVAIGSSLPFPLALLVAFSLFLLGVPFWVVGTVLLPIVSALLRSSQGGPLERAARAVALLQRSLWHASWQASRAASQAARQRRDKRLQSRAHDRVTRRRERDRGRPSRPSRR